MYPPLIIPVAIVEVNEYTTLFVALNTCIRYPVALVPLQLYVALCPLSSGFGDTVMRLQVVITSLPEQCAL